jgi:lipid-A-disaccharide synthase-like uncharacterized protein
MRQHSWQVRFPHSCYCAASLTGQSSAAFHLVRLNAFMLYGMRFSLNHFKYTIPPKSVFYYSFMLLMLCVVILHLYYYYVTNYWNTNSTVGCKCIPVFETVLAVPINHKHPRLYCTLQYKVNSE